MTGNPRLEEEAEAAAVWERQLVAAMKIAEQRRPDLRGTVGMFVAANDYAGMLRAEHRLMFGEPKPTPAEALTWVGSFARMDWVLTLMNTLPEDVKWPSGWVFTDLFPQLCHLWSSADPDDTDYRYQKVFADAAMFHGSMLLDGPPLLPNVATLSVYRGEPGPPLVPAGRGLVARKRSVSLQLGNRGGLSWTTDQAVAIKFATGATARQPLPEGVVLTGYVHREDILAYITGRGESEVLVPPDKVTITATANVVNGQTTMPVWTQTEPTNPLPLHLRTRS